MKNIFTKLLCLAVLAGAFVLPAQAQFASQLEEKTLPVGEFSTISADGDFEVILNKGSYSVRVTTDQNLSAYVQVYVRAKTLYITYDEKAVPKDIKKLYKGKDAPKPVFRAVVSLPELNGFIIDDNVMLASTEEFYGSQVELTLGGKAQVKNLSLRANSITVNMKKNAQAAMVLSADDKLVLNTDDKASLKLNEKAREITLNANGSSDNAFSGESDVLNLNLSEKSTTNMNQQAKKANLQVAGSSKLILTGKAEFLEVKGDKNAEVDAGTFQIEKASADLNGNCKVNVAAEKELSATLQGGSSLFYTGKPTMLIGKIVKSTLAPAGTVK